LFIKNSDRRNVKIKILADYMCFVSCTIIRITDNDFSKIYKVELLSFFFFLRHCSPCHDKEFGIDSQNLCYKDESNYTATASKKIFRVPRVPRERVSTDSFFFFFD
jgi:hypothetical protein